MKRKNVIVVISEEVEVFGNFKKMCEAKGFPYHSLNQKYFKNNYIFICGCNYFNYLYKEFKNQNYEKSFFFIKC